MEFPGEKLLIKMWETLIEKGIGGLIIPYYVVWKNKTLALGDIEIDKASRIAIAKAEKEIAEIENSQLLITNESNLTNEETDLPVNTIQEYVQKNEVKRLIREEINVTQAVIHANNRLLEDDSSLPKENIDPDWLNIWRDNASKVSDEEVQSLWGNVLAQETIKPGRYSLRLLEFLKTISKSDALLIEKLAPFVIDKKLFYGKADNKNFLERFSLTSDELDYLEEINILSQVSSMGMVVTYRRVKEPEISVPIKIVMNENIIFLLKNSKKHEEPKIRFYPLTRIGEEVLSLVNISIGKEYIYWLAQQFTDNFSIEVYTGFEGNYSLEKTFERIK